MVRLWPPLLSIATLLVAAVGSLRAEVPAGWTYTGEDGREVAFDACDNVTDGGTISGNVRGCADPLYQVPQLRNVTLPTGGSGALEFLWMKTTTNPAGGQPVSWDLIAGSTAADYTPAAIAKTTYYMRCSRRAGCDKWAGETNYVTVLIDCCENVTDGGQIGGAQKSCGVPYDPTVLSNVAPATGGLNNLVYAWYKSTTSTAFTPGSSEWAVAGSVTTPYFDPGSITETTHYVRVAQRDKCPELGAWSNVVTVVANPLPGVKTNVEDVTCFGESDGSIAVTILTAVNPVTLKWSDGPSTATTRNNLAAGIYTVTVTDGVGCDYSEDIIVATPAAVAVTIEAVFDRCAFADDAELSATVVGGKLPYTYLWSTGATTQSISGLPAGRYEVTVTDANGCTTSNALDVAPPAPISATASAAQPTCGLSNGSITVATTSGVGPFAYEWSPAVSISDSAEDLPGGTYTIVVTDANACQVTVSAQLDVIAPLSVSLDGDEVSCNGANDAEVRTQVTGGTAPYTYLWAGDETTDKLSGVGPGRYSVTVTDAAGCTSASEITLAQPNALSATITTTQPICFEDGGTLVANITGGTAPYDFNWGAAGQNNEQTLTNLPAGTYTLNVSDAGGCTFTTTATVEATVLLELTSSATPASCPGEDDGTAEVTVTGGQAPYTITWSDDRGQTTATATELLAGTYTATVVDARGCSKLVSAEVTLLSTGPISTSEVDQISCAGADDGAIRLTTTGGLAPYTYAWKDAPAATSDRSGLAAGTYEVTVTDAAGCFAELNFVIVEPEVFTCKAVPTTNFGRYFNVSAYRAADGAIAAQTVGGIAPFTYNWSNGDAGSSASGLRGGDYSLTVTDGKGCVCTHDTTLVEPSQISDFVWEDTDGDGIQDADEPGLAGIRIRLSGSDFNGIGVDFQTTSDADGAYKFDRLPMGNYVVRFSLQGFQDYLFSPANRGTDRTKDSDMDPVLLLARAVVPSHGHGNFDLDAGFIPRTSVITISDKVWYDEDHDGIQDPFEAPVQGVTMSLVRSSDDAVVGTTVSNESGNYAFEDVTPNTYYVSFDQSTSTVAFDFVAGPQYRGVDTTADSDFDPVTKRSRLILVTPSSPDITDLDLGLHEDCATVADGGRILGDEEVCVGKIAGPITSASPATGSVRYQWMRSTTSAIYRGPNDPAWVAITGAVGATYQASSLSVTSYYIRLSRDLSCATDFTGTTNVITKQAIPNPKVAFASVTGNRGATYVNRQITLGLNEVMTVTADSTAPGLYTWRFGADATPSTATGRLVGGITYANTNDSRYAYLDITNAQGCVGSDSFLINTLPFLTPGVIGGTNAFQAPGGNTVTWSAISLPQGAYFDVERARSEGAYEKIAAVAASDLGTWVNYEFNDAGAPSGKTIYRVVHRAPSGESALGKPAVVAAEASLTVLTFPNPVRDRLRVEVLMGSDAAAAEYTLSNVYGATLARGQVDGAAGIDVSGLPAGSYYLTVVGADGETVVRPVVKY